MHNYCDVCGTKMNSEDVCDCIRTTESAPHLVTYADWEMTGDFSRAVKPGDYVEERIVDEMRDCLPPASMAVGYLQVGESYSYEYDPEKGRLRPTFTTFCMKGGRWMYCGHCFAGKVEEPTL